MAFEKELDELKRRKEKALQMGGPERVQRQHEKGKLTVRERISRLLDPDTFLERGMLNCSDMPGMEDKTPADSKIGGFGKIDGRGRGAPAGELANEVLSRCWFLVARYSLGFREWQGQQGRTAKERATGNE